MSATLRAHTGGPAATGPKDPARLRVGINARLLASDSLRGWNRYTLNLVEALHREGIDLALYTDAPLHPTHRERLKNIPVRTSVAGRYARWEQQWLPAACARDGIDVLHTPYHFGLPWFSRCARVMTLHDTIDHDTLAAAPFRERWRMRTAVTRLHRWAARTRAHHIITVSNHARAAVMRSYGIPDERISVIPEAADPRFDEPVTPERIDAVRTRYRLPRQYLLYVGGWDDRKNVRVLIEAFALADPTHTGLVLAGGSPDPGTHIVQRIATCGLTDRTVLPGVVPDPDLPALYAGALGFVYPSLAEGFGLQLCEAMAVGCPVLAADRTSLPEVLGDGGETFDPDDPRELAGLIGRLGSDEAWRQDLARRARARAGAFSWVDTARRTLDVYRQAVRQR